MAERPAQRPFGSVVAEISRMALWWQASQRSDWPDKLWWANKHLAARWQGALNAWRYEAPEAFSPTVWERMRQCASSVYWTPALLPKDGKRPRARFCYQTWLCPFCYGREIVNFLRPFEDKTIQVQSLGAAYESPEQAWEVSNTRTKQLLAMYGAVACWRQVAGCALPETRVINAYALSATWIVPGDKTLAGCGNELIDSLAYPLGTLDDCPWWLIESTADWMRNHRGRVWAGKYHGLTKE